MITLATSLLSLGGFACMALSMAKHYRQVFLAEPTKRGARMRRMAAWLLLCVSLVPAVTDDAASVGIVLWTGVLTVSAFSVTMLLTYWPRATGVAALTAPLLAIVLCGIIRVARVDSCSRRLISSSLHQAPNSIAQGHQWADHYTATFRPSPISLGKHRYTRCDIPVPVPAQQYNAIARISWRRSGALPLVNRSRSRSRRGRQSETSAWAVTDVEGWPE